MILRVCIGQSLPVAVGKRELENEGQVPALVKQTSGSNILECRRLALSTGEYPLSVDMIRTVLRPECSLATC